MIHKGASKDVIHDADVNSNPKKRRRVDSDSKTSRDPSEVLRGLEMMLAVSQKTYRHDLQQVKNEIIQANRDYVDRKSQADREYCDNQITALRKEIEDSTRLLVTHEDFVDAKVEILDYAHEKVKRIKEKVAECLEKCWQPSVQALLESDDDDRSAC